MENLGIKKGDVILASEFLPAFLEEAGYLLTNWEQTCLTLEEQPTQENLAHLFHSTHNLKGSARSMGLIEVGEFLHRIEDFIVFLTEGRAPINSQTVDLFLNCKDVLSEWIEQLKTDSTYHADTSAIIDKLQIFINDTHNGTKQELKKISSNLPQLSIVPPPAPEETPVKKPEKPAATTLTASSTHSKKDIAVSTDKIDTLISAVEKLQNQYAISHLPELIEELHKQAINLKKRGP